MRAENSDAARRDLVELVDEPRALGAQPLDHVPVVHDLMPHVDRRAVFLQRALDNLDRALYPGAEATGLREHDSQTPLCRRAVTGHRLVHEYLAIAARKYPGPPGIG